MDPFEQIPDELLVVQALELDLPSVTRFCQTSRRFNRVVCENESYWHQKFIRDYGFDPRKYEGSWRLLYREYMSLWGFGSTRSGQLSLDDVNEEPTPTKLSEIKPKQVSTGQNHTIIIDLTNDVWVVGANSHGQLGLGDEKNRSTWTRLPGMKAQRVATGELHTVLIDLEKNVWTFGNNYSGQLGLGDRDHRLIPTMIPNLKAIEVSAGNDHTLLIDPERSVWGFGSNWSLGDNHPGVSPKPFWFGRRLLEEIPPKQPEETLDDYFKRYNRNIVPIKAQQVAAGHGHTVILTFDGEVWTYGISYSGELGRDSSRDEYYDARYQVDGIVGKQVAAGHFYTVVLDVDNEVWVFGDNRKGQLGLGQDVIQVDRPVRLGMSAKRIEAGDSQTFLIDFEDDVWATGYNDSGQLGLGDFDIRYQPTQIPNLKAYQISTGRDQTVLIGTMLT